MNGEQEKSANHTVIKNDNNNDSNGYSLIKNRRLAKDNLSCNNLQKLGKPGLWY